MIQYYNDLINKWVLWHLRGHNNGLGLPNMAAFMRMGARCTDSMATLPVIDEEAMVTDRALSAIRVTHPELWEVVEAFYLRTSTWQTAASQLGYSTATLDRRLHQLHMQLQEYIYDIELGEPIPIAADFVVRAA